jgi:hypothetical protein
VVSFGLGLRAELSVLQAIKIHPLGKGKMMPLDRRQLFLVAQAQARMKAERAADTARVTSWFVDQTVELPKELKRLRSEVARLKRINRIQSALNVAREAGRMAALKPTHQSCHRSPDAVGDRRTASGVLPTSMSTASPGRAFFSYPAGRSSYASGRFVVFR